MDKPSLVRHAVLRLPPGFRFHPTDEELVVQYLKRKVFSCPLPAAIIPEIDLGRHDPWDLPGGCEQERYFFNRREARYPNGNRSKRATGAGYWKATGKDKPIVASRSNQVVGMKKVLVFYQGKPPTGARTDWVMHEYRLATPDTRACLFPQRKNSTNSLMVPTNDWVLCRIFKKKRATNEIDEFPEEEIRNRNGNIGLIEFMGQRDRYPQPSSPSSSDASCVTDLSDGSRNREDTSCSSYRPSP